jgi:SAM-dependent methyltransferase
MTPATPERFDAAYFREHYGVTECRALSQTWWSVRLYAEVVRRLLRRTGGRRMLEVGCGFGFILARLEDEFETFGVDASAHAIEQCRRVAPRSRCVVADIEQGFPSSRCEVELRTTGSFDLVLARYVLEHLRAPQRVMRDLAALLRPGGLFLFAVPNTESLGARWKGRDWYALQDPTHCSLLAPEAWRAAARAAGLAIKREFSDGYWDVPYVRWLPRWIQLFFFLAPSALECFLARPILPAGCGENVIVVAQKLSRNEVHVDG